MLRTALCFLLLSLFVGVQAAQAEVSLPSKKVLKKALAALKISEAKVSVSGESLAKRSAAGELPFTRQQAFEIGIDVMSLLMPIDFTPPIWNGRGLASGDIDRDGFLDVLVATRSGVRIFMNQAGGGFSERELSIPKVEELETHVVALVDLDDDGWLDIFLTSYRTGIYYILSDKGKFSSEALVKAPEQTAVLSQSISFGDVDEDGDLDAVIGNYYLGRAMMTPPIGAMNKILFNEIDENGKFRVFALTEAIVGDTHSILLSDFTQDNHLDLIVGNDFTPPDAYYTGDGKGGFKLIKKEDGIIPITTYTTMSTWTVDYNNDAMLDIWMTQIAARATGPSVRLRTRPQRELCDDLVRPEDKAACQVTLAQKLLFDFFGRMQPSDILRCRGVGSLEQQHQCTAMMFWLTVHREENEALCDRMPKSQIRPTFLCHAMFAEPAKGTEEQYAEAVDFSRNENILLKASADGTFENVAREVVVATSGFSWNSKFGDFDNDGWQDTYVVNGTWTGNVGIPQKFFYRNLKGERFEEVSEEFGLNNFSFQSAYLMIDFDNDGDLDLLVNSISGPIWFYKNNDISNNSIIFDLRDEAANRYCIGCKIRIDYGPDASWLQLREIKSGGGYSSFDAAFAHFGLGEQTSIAKVEVTWSTGEKTTIQGPFPANARYTIRRKP